MHVLNLTISAYQGRPCAPQTRRVETGRLTIGRGADIDWHLPDPERVLGRMHCVVERIGDGFTITDLSTNGVFLNGATEALGHNVSAPLADGDEIAIGEYRIRVGLAIAAPQTNFGDSASDPFAAGPPGSNLSWFPPVPPTTDPFRAVPPEATPLWPQPATTPGDPFPAGSLLPAAQPIGDVGWPGSGPFETPAAVFPGEEQASLPLLPNAAHTGLPDPDHVPAINAYFRPPQVQAPVIPPDWNPLQPDAAPAVSGSAPRPAQAVRAMPAAPVPIAPPSPPPPLAAAAAPASAGSAAEAVRAFLGGAGLTDGVLPPGDDLARLHAFGELFREFAAGLRDLVNVRAMTKAGFHLPQTAIAARGNNPFKFSVDVEQLLTALLTPTRPGYAQPLPAIRESLDDLKAHDLALIAATQEAIATVLAGLSPQALQRAAETAGILGNLLPAARKAAWWDAFEQAHRRAAEGVEIDLPGGFRQAFAEAYARQVEKF